VCTAFDGVLYRFESDVTYVSKKQMTPTDRRFRLLELVVIIEIGLYIVGTLLTAYVVMGTVFSFFGLHALGWRR
jgi:hypothetical protein